MTYTIIIDNGVFLAKEPKPEGTWNIRMSLQKIEDTTITHNKALKKWQSKLIRVMNVRQFRNSSAWHTFIPSYIRRDCGWVTGELTHGQQIPESNVTITGGKATINKF